MNNLIAQLLLRFPVEFFRREPIYSKTRTVIKSQHSPPDVIRQLQFENIKRLLYEAFDNIPFYRRSFENYDFHPDQFKSLEDIDRVPFLEKLDVKNSADQMINRNYKGPMDRKTTGGSTGQAVTLLKDRVGTAWLRGVMWRCYDWYGIARGDRQARFWGVPLREMDQWKYKGIDFLMNRIRLSAFGFSDKEMEIYLRRIRHFRPVYFYGYLSMILEFASFLQRKQIDGKEIKLKAIISTSEVLYPHQRTFLENFFGCPVANEYGCGEAGIIAFSCKAGSLHLMNDNLFIEILNDSGDPVAPGDVGEIVITELHSIAMPLIRYRIKDFAKKSSSDTRCQCGVLLPTIDYIVGREYDFLMGLDGKKHHGEQFMYLLESLQAREKGVQQFQIIQTERDRITVNIIKETWASEGTEKEIAEFLHKNLGRDMNIEFRNVRYIEREPSGKIRLIIQKKQPPLERERTSFI